jgi:hypothetical protein
MKMGGERAMQSVVRKIPNSARSTSSSLSLASLQIALHRAKKCIRYNEGNSYFSTIIMHNMEMQRNLCSGLWNIWERQFLALRLMFAQHS